MADINDMTDMFITVLGSSGCAYDYGNDTASYLINNKIIVDTGWHLVENILDVGLNPADFNTILFTHFHHDHYIALPQFLFYYLNSGKSLSELTLIGPSDTEKILDLALNFLQTAQFFENAGRPKCINIKSGESITLEHEQLLIGAHKAVHTIDSRFYRVTDIATGIAVGFSGDTAFDPYEGEFFKGCSLLIHECSLGGKHDGDNSYLHSDAEDATIAASKAGVKTLALVHYSAKYRAECLTAAANKFNGEIVMPVKGDIILVN